MMPSKAFSLLLFALSSFTTNAIFQPEEFISKDGKLDVTLEVDWVTSVNGTRVAPGYNGNAMGPTIRVKPGDSVSITLKNNLDHISSQERELLDYVYNPESEVLNELNVTIVYNSLTSEGYSGGEPKYGFWGNNFMNLHIHGAHVDPKIEDLFNPINGGESRTYAFEIPEDQPPVFAWYHNHVHMTAQYSSLSGLAGAFIIEGTDEDITNVPEIADATEVFLTLSESKVDEAGKPSRSGIEILMDFDWDYVTNGELGETATINFATGETVLFRAIGASSRPPKILTLDDHMILPVAYDGYPVPVLEETNQIGLHAGSRSEFMVTFDKPGTYTMHIDAWNIGIAGPACNAAFGIPLDTCLSYDKPGVALTIIIEDSEEDIPTSGLPEEIPDYHHSLQELEGMPSVKTREIVMAISNTFPILNIPHNESDVILYPASGVGLNGRVYTPHYMHGEIELGTCETWVVFSKGPPIAHTFHIHSVPFLVTNVDGIDQETPFWRDTFPVQLNATIHVCFPRHEGNILVHCHMPAHLERGMAGMYKVVAPPEKEVAVQVDETEKEKETESPTGAEPVDEIEEEIEDTKEELTSASNYNSFSMLKAAFLMSLPILFTN